MEPIGASPAASTIPAIVTPVTTTTVTMTPALLPTATGSPRVAVTPNQLSTLDDHIKQISQRINMLGPGPHNPKQKEELAKLNSLLVKAHKQVQQAQIQGVKPELPSGLSSGLSSGVLTSSPAVPVQVSSRSPVTHLGTPHAETKVLDKRRLTELVREVDPLEQLDDDVEEVLMQIADDFIDSVVNASCQIAKHRKANTVEVKDVQLHLERNWNMWIPGFGSEDLRPYKKAATTEAHKQRMALIKKTMKKY